ncbi:hypothetical protein [Brachyspira hyodysenteriae]|uniref:hypothetical protein n=1 Tax=Brachyspira hyodysenteriae TaxID=159 RepID=UPI00063DB9D7|nr:hypothetical protein [Brachyspira hyodysenteriae]KLI51704.1 hypothetical protein SZ42_05975 [Brachyspira hyodysenteriae]
MNKAQKIVLLINQKTDEYTRACNQLNAIKSQKARIEKDILYIENQISRETNESQIYKLQDGITILKGKLLDIQVSINRAEAKRDTLKIEIDNHHKYLEGYLNMQKEENINFNPSNIINFSPSINNNNNNNNNNISNLDELKNI